MGNHELDGGRNDLLGGGSGGGGGSSGGSGGGSGEDGGRHTVTNFSDQYGNNYRYQETVKPTNDPAYPDHSFTSRNLYQVDDNGRKTELGKVTGVYESGKNVVVNEPHSTFFAAVFGIFSR
jgi:hypothetical protein